MISPWWEGWRDVERVQGLYPKAKLLRPPLICLRGQLSSLVVAPSCCANGAAPTSSCVITGPQADTDRDPAPRLLPCHPGPVRCTTSNFTHVLRDLRVVWSNNARVDRASSCLNKPCSPMARGDGSRRWLEAMARGDGSGDRLPRQKHATIVRAVRTIQPSGGGRCLFVARHAGPELVVAGRIRRSRRG
jgi:hypothetical protein